MSELDRWRRRVTRQVVSGVGAVSMSLVLLVAYGSSPWLRLAWGFLVAMYAYNFGMYLTRTIESRPSEDDLADSRQPDTTPS